MSLHICTVARHAESLEGPKTSHIAPLNGTDQFACIFTSLTFGTNAIFSRIGLNKVYTSNIQT